VYVLLFHDTASADIYNNIIWSNKGADLYIDNDDNDNDIPSWVKLFNNDFDQSSGGTYIRISFPIHPSNLDNLDPLFADTNNDDYHIEKGSPCIDAGINSVSKVSTDFEFDNRIIDGDNDGTATVDMGADEFTDPCEGDLDLDGDVDGPDLVAFADDPFDESELATFASEFGRTDCVE